ncbi:MAG TPA: hypothetical protein VLH10_25725 [Yinghuangia sp.]|uniref:hypothetical protein n=1 Tax=Yinghuangia sp. YIM S10712 TaxID=3436930 RepID=UPI002C79A1F1|nr:hypothetical protein [Yinghuangia sp.]
MSFDLGVWFESQRISSAQAAKKYNRLCVDQDLSVLEAGDVRQFLADLTALHSEPPADAGPWTAPPDVSDRHVIMPISWGRANDVARQVLELASRHDLVCFDPQVGVLHVPPSLRDPRGLLLKPCEGLSVADPEPEVVNAAVRRISARNWFLILTEADQRYVQVGLGPDAGVGAGEFSLEFRDGSQDRHFRRVVEDRDEVRAFVGGFAADRHVDMDVQGWEKLDYW